MNKYNYNKSNMQIEEKMIPTAISFLKQYYPKDELEIIQSYTRYDKTNKYLQDHHVDIILHQPNRNIYIDLKCTDKYDYNFLTFELLRKDIRTNIIREGWTEITDIFPAKDQYILFISQTECALVQKIKFHECRKNNPSQFNIDNINWYKDKGHNCVYKKNKLLYLSRSKDLELLEEMGTKIYNGSITEGWTNVSSRYYKYIS